MDIDTTQHCLEFAAELTRGPALFDELGYPTEAVTRYTGARVVQDEARCMMAGALRLLGCSDRDIARTLGCDVRSIPLMLEAAEKSGRIPALKERLTRLTGQNAERAQLALAGLLNRAADGSESIELASMIKSVATAGGINTQNLQLLTGGATEILEVRVGAGRAEIEEWALKHAIDITPSDLQSGGMGSNQANSGVNEGVTRRDDTAAQVPGHPGGGCNQAAGGPEGDRLTGSKILGEVARG